MTPREMDVVVAEWMGWHVKHINGRTRLFDGDGEILASHAGTHDLSSTTFIALIPPFSLKRGAMAQAEAVVRERGLEERYMWTLTVVLMRDCGDSNGNLPYPGGWHYATATAPQRAEAMVRMIRSQDG